ncbi:MAG: hypothetical protein IIY73_01910 [Solobacterium sp.]|nr:hypothetical protein [Solobacterium sp.]
MIRTQEDLENLIEEWGFVPFFENEIEGFSIKEQVDPKLWFTDEPGVWEMKGPIAVKGRCAYGKFFGKKAGFVSKKWFADLLNYRRDGYDFDSLCDEGRVPEKDREIVDLLNEYHVLTTKEIKPMLGYSRNGRKGYDTVITRLQMETYVTVKNFVYAVDRKGEFYGWGIAQYTTPEEVFGRKYIEKAYKRSPEESLQRMIRQIRKIRPGVSVDAVRQFLK